MSGHGNESFDYDEFSNDHNVPQKVILTSAEIEEINTSNSVYLNLSEGQNTTAEQIVSIKTNLKCGQSEKFNNNENNWETNPHYVRLKRFIGCSETLKLISHAYNQQGGYLTEKARKLLVHKFVDLKKKVLLQEFKGTPLDDWNIDVLDLNNFATTIEKVFPTENAEAYYSPFKIENGVRLPSAGKLRYHLDYVKGELRKEGIIKPYNKNKKSDKNPAKAKICVFEETIETKLKYLETHSDDVDKVKEYWFDTREARLKVLTVEQKSVHDYCQKFKGLREQLGFELIELDFKYCYPEKVNSLSVNWIPVKEHLLKILKTVKLSQEDKSLLNLIPTFSTDHQNAVLFHLLIYVFPTVEVKKSKKRKTSDSVENQVSQDNQDNIKEKKTLNEKRESYLLVVPIANEEDATLDRLKITLLSKDLTLQPIIVIVGSLLNVKKIYVVIDDTWYACKSVLEAVAFTFKAFFALQCAYPVETYNVWHFIQRAIFGIKIAGEKVSLKIRSLEKQIENILRELEIETA